MNNIVSENILWSIGTIVALFGIIAHHRLVSFRDRRNSFATASSELIAAFAPAIARIDAAILHVGTWDQPDINKFLCDNFEIHIAAVKRFSANLSSNRKRGAYEKAWKEYCDLEPNEGGITLFAGHLSPNGKHLELIKERIENILIFAKYK